MKLQILGTRSLKNSWKLDLTSGKVIILHKNKNKNKQSKPVNERLGGGESKTVRTRISAQFNINYGSIVWQRLSTEI